MFTTVGTLAPDLRCWLSPSCSPVVCAVRRVGKRAGANDLKRTQTYSPSRDVKTHSRPKCIACHACYDAPCQLKLTSGEGLLRAPPSDPVYNGARLGEADPTRLFVDAHGPGQWRQKGFSAVLNDWGWIWTTTWQLACCSG